ATTRTRGCGPRSGAEHATLPPVLVTPPAPGPRRAPGLAPILADGAGGQQFGRPGARRMAAPRWSRAILAQGDAETMATDAASQASSKNDELINADLVRKWLASGLGWLLFFPTIGALVSTKFTYPEFLGDTAWLTFGRLRPIHVNGVIWGAFSTIFIGLCHYIVPRLTGVRLWRERWSYALLLVWNL